MKGVGKKSDRLCACWITIEANIRYIRIVTFVSFYRRRTALLGSNKRTNECSRLTKSEGGWLEFHLELGRRE